MSKTAAQPTRAVSPAEVGDIAKPPVRNFAETVAMFAAELSDFLSDPAQFPAASGRRNALKRLADQLSAAAAEAFLRDQAIAERLADLEAVVLKTAEGQ